jgi:outer membrane receptor for monomeric catechols
MAKGMEDETTGMEGWGTMMTAAEQRKAQACISAQAGWGTDPAKAQRPRLSINKGLHALTAFRARSWAIC